MKEMIKALIADGWVWGALDPNTQTGHVYIYKGEKPVELRNGIYIPRGKYAQIPSCLIPFITASMGVIELKTLLVKDEEETLQSARDEEEQNAIRMLIENDYSYLVRKHNNEIGCLKTGEEQIFYSCLISSLAKHVPNKYEKVYLKDLVKKRKVKKSVWLERDPEGLFITNKKEYQKIPPLEGIIESNSNYIELTYEVEE